MKKALAFVLSVLIMAGIGVQSFAVVLDDYDWLSHTERVITDIVEADFDYTDYEKRDDLTDEKRDLLEESRDEIHKIYSDDIGTQSLYWVESDYLPVKIYFHVDNFDLAEAFEYRKYIDGKWVKLKPEFNYEKKIVSVVIEENGPFLITYIPINTASVSTSLDSVTGQSTTVTGTKSAAFPTVIECKAVLTPIDVIETLSYDDLMTAIDGYNTMETQLPEGMTARYVFWSDFEDEYRLVVRMDDVKVDDVFGCSLYDGDWHELETEMLSDGIAAMYVPNTGLMVIFTEKGEIEEE